MKRAIYAGSFDPITLGHLWMIREGSRLFDEVVVAIGVNPDKKPAFTLLERLEMIKDAVKGIKNVTVTHFTGQYLVNYAKSIKADYLLRGIRQESDYEYERGLRHINNNLDPDISTVFLMPPKEMSEVSSSMVKGMVGPLGWHRAIKPYLPLGAYEALLRQHCEKLFFQHWTEAFTTKSPPAFHGELQMMESGPSGKMFHRIWASYSNPYRSYHNMEHILDCLAELETCSTVINDVFYQICPSWNKPLIALAIWFHDVVYNPQAQDNEEKSAEFFKELTQTRLATWKIDEITKMILATKKHSTDVFGERVLCDIDLSILGQKHEIFTKYCENIRKEYSWVPLTLYNRERKKILESFLKRDSIYQTKYFQDRFEQKAKANLAAAIERLT